MRFMIEKIAVVLLGMSLGMGCSMAPPPPAPSNQSPEEKSDIKVSVVRVLHVAQGTDSISVSIDNRLAYQSLSYGSDTGFIRLEPGRHNVKIVRALKGRVLAEVQVDIDPTKQHSVFVHSTQEGLIRTLVHEQTPSLKPSDDAKVRLLHFPKQAPAMNFEAIPQTCGAARASQCSEGSGEELSSAPLSGGTLSSYQSLAGGEYRWTIRSHSSGELLALVPELSLQSGETYTFVFLGLSPDSNSRLQAFLINDKGGDVIAVAR